ncbi:MAG: sodium-translocating pyrophosphatase [Planctomycetaceae bacterium]|nr:sodium-translocating pyrophosphatase [Planctomycetaceae bacterium]
MIVGAGASVFALFTARQYFEDVKRAEPGNARMQEIASAVREGAMAYLTRQRNVVIPVLIVIGVLVAFGANYELFQTDPTWAVLIFLGFITGGIASFSTGWYGMKTATLASNRTAWACTDATNGLDRGLQVAFKAGSVMGLSVVGIGLAFVISWLAILIVVEGDEPAKIGEYMLSFGMGASTVALFARVGGGIFTKAADVGGDLVGKVEAGIPEDDPRNPATIADNVGDNVGDVAGMGADLYESYVGSILAAMALAFPAALAATKSGIEGVDPWKFMVAPIAMAAAGIFLSILGTKLVKTREGASLKDLLGSLHRAVNIPSILMAFAAIGIASFCFPETHWWGIGLATVFGLLSGLFIAKGSEIYTAYDYRPTQRVSESSKTGPATVIISGMAAGMMSTWVPVVVIAITTALAYGFSGGFSDPQLGLYGISLAAVGMLSTLGVTLATDAYGPIADNAGGNAEMSGLPPEVRERTDALDSLGNTTAAIGKGFAIGSAALTALGLIAAFVTSAQSRTDFDILKSDMITITNPMVICGLFIGGLLVFVFAAMTMTAVGDAALYMVEEVRRQFKEKPGIMAGTEKPDYARCVDISTSGAIKKMIVPSLLAIIAPVVVGVVFGVGGVVGMLAGGLACGFAVAIFMANAGGSWDNAKKYIEKGNLGGKYLKNEAGQYVDKDGNVVEKREQAKNPNHGAAVIGDTVGDPFKDTSGPSLNILIKLLSMVSVATIAVTMMVNDGKGIFDMVLKNLFGK